MIMAECGQKVTALGLFVGTQSRRAPEDARREAVKFGTHELMEKAASPFPEFLSSKLLMSAIPLMREAAR